MAEPVRANDTDDVIPAAEQDTAETTAASPSTEPVINKGTETEMPKAETPRFDEPASMTAKSAEAESAKAETPRFDEPDPVSKSQPEAPTQTAAKPEPAKASEQKPSPERKNEQPSGPKPEERPSQSFSTRRPQPEAKPAQRAAPATSTLVAAGIFGGLVALLLAGSMQYAGFIPGGASSSSSDANVSAELASLRQEVAALANRPADTSGADLEGRVATLESNTSTGAPDEAMTQRLAALESELSTIKSATEANAGRLQQAEAQINDRGPEQQAARAVAAAALKGAIDRGGSFEAELRTYETVSGGDQAIAELQPFATKGVLSRTELQRQASSVANSMIDAVSQPDPNEGIASRLLSSAMSVVKVRRVGDVEGDTPDAIVARFEDRLRSGDLPAAAREWDTLPDAAKAASQEFKQELDARIQVENLVGGALTRAIAGTQG
ncbi:mitofilin family membrane protein [Aliirhizobium terrae]|uniref:COG4223 family protein n=1 Tax=Terrirhizobium terrae TaxID=2926709 RepID=UPI0025765D64|nr:mitofilin family membrane protein [Rhizobium sp. CC-CFT758]WJH41341.1 mitofilin family membrane protein [Rhizobium sp. CC-CFT758]